MVTLTPVEALYQELQQVRPSSQVVIKTDDTISLPFSEYCRNQSALDEIFSNYSRQMDVVYRLGGGREEVLIKPRGSSTIAALF